MKIFRIILLFVSSFGLLSCVSNTKYPEQQYTPASSSLSGQWSLSSLNGSGYSGDRITLQFSDSSRVNGFSGCNRYFGSSSKSNGNLSFGSLGSTKKLCRNSQSNQVESAYLNGLRQVRSYRLNGNQLILQGHSTNLVFSKS